VRIPHDVLSAPAIFDFRGLLPASLPPVAICEFFSTAFSFSLASFPPLFVASLHFPYRRPQKDGLALFPAPDHPSRLNGDLSCRLPPPLAADWTDFTLLFCITTPPLTRRLVFLRSTCRCVISPRASFTTFSSAGGSPPFPCVSGRPFTNRIRPPSSAIFLLSRAFSFVLFCLLHWPPSTPVATVLPSQFEFFLESTVSSPPYLSLLLRFTKTVARPFPQTRVPTSVVYVVLVLALLFVQVPTPVTQWLSTF